MKNILLTIAAQTVLIAGTITGTWFLFLNTHGGSAGGEETMEAEGEAKPAKDPVYYSIEPPFIVNLQDTGSLRFLQVQVDLMTRNPDVVERLEKYNTRIRNDLILLFGAMTRDALSQPDGKTNLQKSALETVNKVLVEEGGEAGVEAVYFTKFVMQ